MRKRLTALLLPLALGLLLPVGALALTGQSYDTFETYYKANVEFINTNAGRHLLPMVLSQRKSDTLTGGSEYDVLGDVLTVSVSVDTDGVIVDCEIHLLKPSGMEYGNSVYNDFTISGYHSYAFLMAMSASAQPADRYALVSDVESGLKAQNGTYERQIGAYTLSCSLNPDQGVVFTFHNNGVLTETPQPETTPQPTDGAATPTDGGAPADDTTGTDDFVG